MERQEGRVSSTFRHVMPVDEGSEGASETVMDLKRLRAHQRQALVDRGAPPGGLPAGVPPCRAWRTQCGCHGLHRDVSRDWDMQHRRRRSEASPLTCPCGKGRSCRMITTSN